MVALADDGLRQCSIVGLTPHAHSLHQVEYTRHEPSAHLVVDALSDAHLHYQTGGAGGIEGMGECGFEYGSGIVYPDEIHA